jgi:hypothetical protein
LALSIAETFKSAQVPKAKGYVSGFLGRADDTAIPSFASAATPSHLRIKSSGTDATSTDAAKRGQTGVGRNKKPEERAEGGS